MESYIDWTAIIDSLKLMKMSHNSCISFHRLNAIVTCIFIEHNGGKLKLSTKNREDEWKAEQRLRSDGKLVQLCKMRS